MEKNLIEHNLFLLLEEVLGIEQININQTMDDVPEWDSLKHIQILSSFLFTMRNSLATYIHIALY